MLAPEAGKGLFPATRWTLIRSAQSSPEARQQAMRTLLEVYWRPLYVFLRKKGLAAEEAQDAVQDLMAQLIERDFLSKAQPEKGRLRSYLMASASNALANRHEASSAQRRGGGVVAVPLDAELAEKLAQTDARSADDAFDREWALGIIDRALAALKTEYAENARTGPFELIAQFFRPEGGEPPAYKDVAVAYGMTIPQLKSFLHRARGRFKALVRAEVAETVDTEAETDAELAELIAILGR